MINKMLMLMNDSKALAACIRGMKGLAVPEEKLKANQVPVLAIIGDKDPLKAGVDEMQARMSNLKVSVITGADHMTTFHEPQVHRRSEGLFSRAHRGRGNGDRRGELTSQASGCPDAGAVARANCPGDQSRRRIKR